MPYSVTLVGQPLSFWDIAHRPTHFAQFMATEANDVDADIQDAFA